VRAYGWVAGCTLLGVAVGVGAGRAWAKHDAARALFDGSHESRERLFLDALSGELDLDSNQRAAISEIATRHGPERRQTFRRVFTESGRDLALLHERMVAEILAQLNPSQGER
jgi:hypothetical protein